MKINIATILTAILIVLKLTGYITINWWWVFSPLWIPIVLSIVVMLAVCMVVVATIGIAWVFAIFNSTSDD